MNAPAIELIEVQKSFGNVSIIRDLNLSVQQGERHALIGPNGAGKSTTFNLISGYMAPTSGSVKLRGEPISGLPPYQINRRGLSRSFQVTNVFANMTVWENLRCAVSLQCPYPSKTAQNAQKPAKPEGHPSPRNFRICY